LHSSSDVRSRVGNKTDTVNWEGYRRRGRNRQIQYNGRDIEGEGGTDRYSTMEGIQKERAQEVER
jgi:hypothetical protein